MPLVASAGQVSFEEEYIILLNARNQSLVVTAIQKYTVNCKSISIKITDILEMLSALSFRNIIRVHKNKIVNSYNKNKKKADNTIFSNKLSGKNKNAFFLFILLVNL